jgi:hypothetical protein
MRMGLRLFPPSTIPNNWSAIKAMGIHLWPYIY